MSRISMHPFYVENKCNLHICPGENHHPIVEGYADNPLGYEEIKAKLANGCDRYCWLLGPRDLVIDVDDHGDAAGIFSLLRLEEDIGIRLSDHCRATVKTPRGGTHYCFRVPSWVEGLRRLDPDRYPGIDCLGGMLKKSSLVIAAGSTHAMVDGIKYRFVEDEPELLMVPSELLAKMVKAADVGAEEGQDLGRPGDAFMRSLKGVWVLFNEMRVRGYTFQDLGEFLSFDRPGKASTSGQSGFLGKQSSSGAYQLTSFSLADPHWEQGRSYTILEALRLLMGWDRKEVIRRVAALGFGKPKLELVEGEVVTGEGLPGFANYELVERGDKFIRVPKPMDLLVPEWLELSGGWPKACQGGLFMPGDTGKVVAGVRTAEVFAMMWSRARLDWGQGGGMVSKPEFAEALKLQADQIEAIQLAPHFPPRGDCWYLTDVEDGDVQDLYDFVDHFNPYSDVDRELMIAAVVTPFWGGPPGSRPLICVTSPDQQGAGKSTFCEAIARLTGMGRPEYHQIRKKQDLENVTRAMGSRAGKPASKRIVLIDNYVGAALSGQDLEAMVTAESLSGWRLYVGDVDIPNFYTWMVTGNHVDMSEDMAQRSVEIQVAKPAEYSDAWGKKLRAWDVGKVLAGIAAFFRLPKSEVESSRFGHWCSSVVGRLEHPPVVMSVLRERGESLSLAGEDAEEMEEVIQRYILANGGNIYAGRWHIKSRDLARHMNSAKVTTSSRSGQWTAHSVTRALKKAMARIDALEPCTAHKARGFIYRGRYADESAEVEYDYPNEGEVFTAL